MQYHCDCDKCGRRTTAYTLHLSRPLVLAFLKFADARIRLRRPVAKGEMGLTTSQYSNFMNLRHLGIIAQLERGGPWDFTRLGLDFLAGRVALPTPVAHMGGETLEEDHLAWSTHVGKCERKTIRQVMPEGFEPREYYKDEKRDLVA